MNLGINNKTFQSKIFRHKSYFKDCLELDFQGISSCMQTFRALTYFLVGVNINSIQLAESNKVCSHKDAKFLALTLSLLSVPCVTLVLYSYPQLIHFSKVQEHKGYRVFYRSVLVLRFSSTIEQKFQKNHTFFYSRQSFSYT